MVEPTPLRATSLHDSVAARLRTMVFDREIAPGEWIDEKALSESWQISRTPLREALKVLAAEGLVDLVPHRGCRVIELADDDADALFPVMAMLEGRCAREAARLATDDQLRGLQRLHEDLERHAAAHDLQDYYRVNHEFHGAVQHMAANRWLERATGDLRRFMRLMRGRQLALPGRIEASLDEHRGLLAAFMAKDAEAAERAMHDHLMAQLAAFKALRAAPKGAASPTGDATPTTETPKEPRRA
jgi:DNA-binding GntR family transcriptional regulator